MVIGCFEWMAAVFTAFDRPIYQRLIPQHLADFLSCTNTKTFAYSVHLTCSNGHGVGIDEAHEMKINKDSKLAVVRPSQKPLLISCHFIQNASTTLKNT